MSKRLSRLTLIAVTAAGLAFSTGTASANPSDTALEHRSDNRPGDGVLTHADDHRPGGAGHGRKVG
jgi:hypothetical protein